MPGVTALLLAIAVGLGVVTAVPARAAELVDAVLAVAETDIVTASDVALARALGLLGFAPSPSPIDAADVERYVRVLLVLAEARRLAIDVPTTEVDEVARAIEERAGGRDRIDAWLRDVHVSRASVDRVVEAHVRWRRFIRLRFVEMTFVTPEEIDAAVGSAPLGGDERARAYERLRDARAERALEEWLDARSKQASVTRLVDPGARVSLPFGAFGR